MVGRHRIERCFRGFTDQTRCQPLPRPFIQSLLDNQPPLAVIVILPYSAQRLCNKDLTMFNLEVFTSFLQPVNSRLYPKKFATLFGPELFEESNLSFPFLRGCASITPSVQALLKVGVADGSRTRIILIESQGS